MADSRRRVVCARLTVRLDRGETAAPMDAAALHRVNSWDQAAADEGGRLNFGRAGRRVLAAWAAEVEAWLAGKSTDLV